jgi:hypothetical protein
MAEEAKAGAADAVTGFEHASTETLLKIRRNMAGGFGQVYDHQQAGTLDIRPKAGAATPREAGQTIVMLFDGITVELQRRGVME